MKVPVSYLHEHGLERADAGEALFVERALTFVETEAYNTEIPPLEGKKYIPWFTGVDPGAKFFEYFQYTRTGIAKLISARGSDIPNVNVYVKNFTRQLYRLGAAYEYTLDDLLASQFAAQNQRGPMISIDAEKAIAAREAIDRGHDKIAALGTTTDSDIPGLTVGVGPDVDMLGLLNQTNASTYTVTNGGAGSQAWSTKTPDEKLYDLTGMVAALEAATYKAFRLNTILLPIEQFRRAAGQRMGDGSDESVISLFKKLNPGMEVDSWQYCDGAGSGGADRMVGFDNNPRRIKYVVAEEFRQMPAQFKDLTFKVPCIAKTAGVVSPYPLSVIYGDSI